MIPAMTGDEVERLWTEAELADRLHLSLNKVKSMRYAGTGPPFVRIGNRVRYDPRAVRQWLDQQQQPPPTPA